MSHSLRIAMMENRDLSKKIITKESHNFKEKVFWNESLHSWVLLQSFKSTIK